MRDVRLARAVSRAARGDPVALGAFYDATAPSAYGLAVGLAGSRRRAEDLLRDSYRSALDRADELEETTFSVQTWFLTVVHEQWHDRPAPA